MCTEFLQLMTELYVDAERLGPGSREETLYALQLTGLDLNKEISAVDLGCGTGASALTLAENIRGHITAVDLVQPFLDRMMQKYNTGADRMKAEITACCRSMEQLDFAEESLDLIWAEGSIYNTGFTKSLNYLKRFLKKDGAVAVSDLCFLRADPAEEVKTFWEKEYPDISDPAQRISELINAGYRICGCFTESKKAHLQNYYDKLQAHYGSFLNRYRGNVCAEEIVALNKKEADLFRRFHDHCSYVFFIARKC